MKTEKSEVKSKSSVVGVAEFPVYDSVAEAVEHIGEDAILKLVNTQVKTNVMNDIRAAATSKPSKKSLRNKAIASITMEEFQGVAGDEQRLQTLIEKKMGEIEAQLLAAAKANPSNEEDEEGEED